MALPFEDMATDPPSGTLSASTPWLEYVQLPTPSDHQRPQYASVGEVFTRVLRGRGLALDAAHEPGLALHPGEREAGGRELRGGGLPGTAGVAHTGDAAPSSW